MSQLPNTEDRPELSQTQLKGLFDNAKPLGHQTPIKLRNGIQLTPSSINCPHCDNPTPTARLRARIVTNEAQSVTRCFMFSHCDNCCQYFASAEAYVAKAFSAQLCMLIGDEWVPYCETKLPFTSRALQIGCAALNAIKKVSLSAGVR